MQTFQSVLSLIQPDCFMATIDTKDLEFLLNSSLLKFVVLPNCVSPGPRKFTKLTKPPLALLRIRGHTVVIYIDDIISVDDTFESCLLTVRKTIKLFRSLGFVIHPGKSKTLYHPKKLNILALLLIQREWLHISVNQCQSISKKQDLKIRDVASLTLTSTFPANKYGPLYYRAVLKSKDDFQ